MNVGVGLPECERDNAIWVVLDRLSKTKNLVPSRDDTHGQRLGELSIHDVFNFHGLPDTIVSCRGPQFTSELWRYVCEWLGTE